MSKNPIIFEDTFTVTANNRVDAVYQRVSRIQCTNETGDMTIESDINTEVFPIPLNQRLTITLANSLELSANEAGKESGKHYDHSIYHRETLLNDCDYAMHGRVYSHEVKKDESSETMRVKVHVSCGGLLTQISGKPNSLRDIHYNNDVYILIKKSD
ncbi:DNA-directed RNA polymerases I, II, and III subunit RPABC3 [Angomonas deanei]|nr:DNA-directed RNA polymerases I, II, and III subunit RPABC3 [Angomonas deanei]EPY43722.1 DNA-directed RNA polymerases I, II, and III subunit RPABC3 [Angomonas deanei]|eukprot:EPY24736.1 DNA-directed RNA polymerases I, II, and III subunit RPABC3 [Angomonas deanei]